MQFQDYLMYSEGYYCNQQAQFKAIFMNTLFEDKAVI